MAVVRKRSRLESEAGGAGIAVGAGNRQADGAPGRDRRSSRTTSVVHAGPAHHGGATAGDVVRGSACIRGDEYSRRQLHTGTTTSTDTLESRRGLGGAVLAVPL